MDLSTSQAFLNLSRLFEPVQEKFYIDRVLVNEKREGFSPSRNDNDNIIYTEHFLPVSFRFFKN